MNFKDNSSFNIVELDAASNNSVENMRQLIEQVRFYPQQGKYKVFIIDEVHMLSTSAFNAFLKTLEEPPEYVVFILATTEKNKILPTILSRCQVFDFKRITDKDIMGQLEKIAKSSSIICEEEALRVIAQKADGAMRDALSIFDRVVSLNNGKLDYATVTESLNVLDYNYYLRITEQLLTINTPGVLQLFDDIVSRGFDPHEFILGLSQHFRTLLYCLLPGVSDLIDLSEEVRKKYIAQSHMCRRDFLINAMNLSNECELQYRQSRNKRLHVELCLMKIAHMAQLIEADPADGPGKKKLRPLEQVDTESERTETSLSEDISHKKESLPQQQTARKIPKPVEEDKKNKETNVSPSNSKTESQFGKSEKEDALSMKNLSSLDDLEAILVEDETESERELNLDDLLQHWEKYKQEKSSAQLKTMMESCHLALDEEQLQIEVPSEMARSRIQEEKELMEPITALLMPTSRKITFIIDEKLQPDDTDIEKLPVTNAEKMAYFEKKNPLFREMVDKLSLKIKQ
jgi:DNA polymerase-3 subunit gamma/tau